MPEKKLEQLDMDTSVAPGADVGDALRDLTPDEFTSLMSELGYELFGPKKNPVQKPATMEMGRQERIQAIRDRIRGLINKGYKLNPAGASQFSADLMMQRKMDSYRDGLGAGTGGSAEALAERMRQGK